MAQFSIVIEDAGLKAALARFGGPAVARVMKPFFERRGNDARREAVKVFVARGIGRGIFGRNDSGAWKIIQLSKVEESGGNLSMKLSAVGLAGLQEVGGRIAPHVIEPKNRKALKFAVAGELAFAAVVNHPGATVKKYPALVPAAEKLLRLVAEDGRAALAALWSKAA